MLDRPAVGEIRLMTETEDAHGDEDYALLGRYIADFSLMVSAMRDSLVFRLHGGSSLPPLAVWAVVGELGARQTADAFFSVARLALEHDGEEAAVSAKLQAMVDKEIGHRNRFAHHDWEIGWFTSTAKPDGRQEMKPLPARTFRARARNPVFKTRGEDLRQRSESVRRLIAMLRDYGSGSITATGTRRVKDVMLLEGEQIVPGSMSAGWDPA